MRKQFLSFAVCLGLTASIVSCSDNASTSNTGGDTSSMTGTGDTAAVTTPQETGVMVGGANMVPSKNIVENAVNSSEHTTLVAAVKAAGLDSTLSGSGPFTVFAPTNAAFAKLPAGTVDNLLKPEMKSDLAKVLTYHVVSGSYRAADLKDGQELTTVQGGKLKVSIKDGKVMINDANVTIADVISSNGVTHVIDGVVLPK
ncbi:MAG TPA: fasciclin domain-containing protein [Flavisolibacter sp.]|nr:fasciclin domain-containing protein [Flavisolibacter sp.]